MEKVDSVVGGLVTFDYASVPEYLRSRDQWVAFIVKPGKPGKRPDKLPVNPRTRGWANHSTPRTWGSFDEALALFGGRDRYGNAIVGVGFVLTEEDDVTCVDVDLLDERGWAIVRRLDSWTETSISGEGAHAWVRGKKPGPRCRKGSGPEMYSSKRFIAMTGRHLEGTPDSIEERQAELEELYREEFGDDGDVPAPGRADRQASDDPDPPAPAASTEARRANATDEDVLEARRENMTDDDVLGTMFGARNGGKARALWEGDFDSYPSQSEADQALCSHISFYVGPDPERVERLFGESALGRREKWTGRADYRQRTVAKAIATTTRFWGDEPSDDETRTRDGPHGLTFTIRGARRTPEKRIVTIDVALGKKTIPGLTVTSANYSLESTSSEIVGVLLSPKDKVEARSQKLEVKQALRELLLDDDVYRDKEVRPSIIEVLRRDVVAPLELAFQDDRGRLWSERCGRWFVRRDLNDVLRPATLKAAAQARDYEPQDPAKLVYRLEKLLGVLWGETLESAPREADADLGPDSKAGARWRQRLLSAWLHPKVWERWGDGARRTTLGSLAAGLRNSADKFDAWKRLHEAVPAWGRVVMTDEVDEHGLKRTRVDLAVRVDLAMRFELLQTMRQPTDGLRSHDEFGRMLKRYGLASDSVLTGKNRERARLLETSVADEILDVVSEEVRNGKDLEREKENS